MTGKYKRGGSGGRGGFKNYGNNKRSQDDGDDAPRKKGRVEEEEEEGGGAFVGKLEKDDDGNSFVALKSNGMRRVTVSEFKGKAMVSIREYWRNDAEKLLPGKKGISLTIDQYNALVSSLPLIESALVKQGEKVIRPDYDGDGAGAAGSDDEEEEVAQSPEDDEDE
ncbi:transcriptional Coactivator p15-domain-containing protein [Lophiotrema nucula]|uniref:Transcriptional Coactivator p15-domain-containing protein n=1 Tax=Lophiotrema nucula TaxID=690887 RepID=A0A6A5Z785_9PLEO|nr:transcriptional Coactivator p15-domain-containing protein [Lophiotrema nucula]